MTEKEKADASKSTVKKLSAKKGVADTKPTVNAEDVDAAMKVADSKEIASLIKEGVSAGLEAESKVKLKEEVQAEEEEDDGDVEEAEEVEPEDKRDLIIVDNENCVQCLHLYEYGAKDFKKCHFTKGNKNCPAQIVRIIIGIPIVSTAKKLARAQIKGNLVAFNEISVALADKDPELVSRVMKKMNSILNDPEQRKALMTKKVRTA